MYPSAAAPDFGVFVQGLERELAARGHELRRVVLEGRPGVTVTGYVPHDAVPSYLAAADVLCQPSLVVGGPPMGTSNYPEGPRAG